MNAAARVNDEYELDRISNTAASFLQQAAAEIPLLSSCEIAILDSSADGGLPHTRPPKLICLPAKLCKAEPASDDFKTTLLHEGIHVHQRMYSHIWKKALNAAGWKEIPREKIPEELVQKIRINPDTLASPYWAWDGQIPIPIFENLISPQLSGARTEWYDLSTGAVFHKPPQSLLDSGSGSGSSSAELEHPYELYAYKFSKEGIDSHEKILEALEKL